MGVTKVLKLALLPLLAARVYGQVEIVDVCIHRARWKALCEQLYVSNLPMLVACAC